MRPRANPSMDADGLQADVMRFMAIIAFCLIAVLALVRQIEPSIPDAADSTPVSAPTSSVERSKREPQVVLSKPQPVLPPVKAKPMPELMPGSMPESKPSSEPEPPVAALEPIPALPEPPRVEPTVPIAQAVLEREPSAPVSIPPAREGDAATASSAAMAPIPEAAGDPEPQAQDDEEQGLSLRFATDQDFLRLIARGDVGVYLFSAAVADPAAFKLAQDYSFRQAAAPRQLFEMLPDTIPEQIRNRARRALANDPALRFGLEFPLRIQTQIERYVSQVQSGELLIDRYGRVRHVNPQS